MAAIESTNRLIHFQSLLKPWLPTATAIRWRTRKPNIQRPIPDHYVKARYKAALEPIYPDPLTSVPWFQVCGNILAKKEDEEVGKYEELLAKLFHSRFADSQLIAIFHENSTKAHEIIKIKQMLHGHNMKMVFGSRKIATMALANTEFEPVLRLHVGKTAYLCSKDLQVSKLLKFTKKMASFVLLGGVVQGRLLTRNELLWCSTLPDINMLRAELCSILTSSTSQLSQSLTYQQQQLARSLEQHIKQNGETSYDGES
ncbi:large ribosomal subunit protein uL10m-like [Daphnia carinata]|uniref:large ribosomal subunit protein uL10m-like n=1 Tax=Daphnia carinata TaxID=120202 RepID=UPI00258009D7|nr:large ribosomal subunit protein uL10m-like [Daphnia carinata]